MEANVFSEIIFWIKLVANLWFIYFIISMLLKINYRTKKISDEIKSFELYLIQIKDHLTHQFYVKPKKHGEIKEK